MTSGGKCPWYPGLCTDSTVVALRAERSSASDGAEIHRDQRGVPVVGVEQDRPRHQPGQRREAAREKKAKRQVIVGIVGRALAVDAVAD